MDFETKVVLIQLNLRLRSIMIGCHFHANMKVEISMCKGNNNSKSSTATYMKFDMYISIYDISRLCAVYKIFDSTDSLWILYQLTVFYSVFYFVEFSGKYHGKCFPILYACLNGCQLTQAS